MKTRFILSIILALCPMLHAPCQIPQGFNYQAIARDVSDNPIVNTPMPVLITIQSEMTGGTIFWQELHSSVTTNSFGMLTLVVGKGVKQAGTASTFADIDWSVSPKYIKTEVYYENEWKDMGVSQLWSVPYSITAEELAGSVKKLTVTGETTSLEEALFEVKNKDGKTIFAVYNEGVRVYVDDGIEGKGNKGGFAIGSFDSSKGIYQDYFVVNADSIRAYINTDTLKGKKGGFAIGGFDPSKAEREEFLRVTRDSTRIYLNNTATKARKGAFAIGSFDKSKGSFTDYMLVSDDSVRFYIRNSSKYNKGGFAIGGFDESKGLIPQFLSVNFDKTVIQVNDSTAGFSLTNIQTGESQNFLRMNPINYRIGHQSGDKLNQLMAKYNTFIGYQSGFSTTDGRENLFIGYKAGYSNLSASYNVYLGTESGKSNISGTSNVFIGFGSGRASTNSNNTYIGMKAGYANAPGVGNTYIGYCSGVDDGRPSYTGGSYNTFLGFNSGAKNYTGSNNVYLGAEASGNSRGSGRIFIGYKAGYSTFGDSLLVIENHESATPLVYGEFANNIFRIYGTLQYTVAISQYSDQTLKTNIAPVGSTLLKILDLQACTFNWKNGALYDHEMPSATQIGLIAQDVEKLFPEIVSETSDGFKTIDYTKIGVLMIPAIKELYEIIKNKDSEISNLRSEIELLNSRLYKLETIVSALTEKN